MNSRYTQIFCCTVKLWTTSITLLERCVRYFYLAHLLRKILIEEAVRSQFHDISEWVARKINEVPQYTDRIAKSNGIDLPVLSVVKDLEAQCVQTHRRKWCRCQLVSLQPCWPSLTAKRYPAAPPAAGGGGGGGPSRAGTGCGFPTIPNNEQGRKRQTQKMVVGWNSQEYPRQDDRDVHLHWDQKSVCDGIRLFYPRIETTARRQTHHHQLNWEQAYGIFMCTLRRKGGFFPPTWPFKIPLQHTDLLIANPDHLWRQWGHRGSSHLPETCLRPNQLPRRQPEQLGALLAPKETQQFLWVTINV